MLMSIMNSFRCCFLRVSRISVFEEVDFLVLDSEALFIRKAGEITDQVSIFLLKFAFLIN